MSADLISAAVATMVSLAPPGRSLIVDARESEDEGRRRYAAIAASVFRVAATGSASEAETRRKASLLLGVSFMESGWRRDVDLGVGPLSRGDRGASCSLFQFNLGRGRTDEGWSCEDLLADRDKAATAALKKIGKSLRACRHLPREHRLAVYASGSCTRGLKASRARMAVVDRIEAQLREASR